MAENKMAEVAALFGKQLGEEFKLEVVKDNKFLPKRKIFTAKFTKVGLERLTKYNAWEQINCFIPSLLTGELEIMEG
jgi:hypothetical protein